MPGKARFRSNEKKLIRRYLMWCYKTTKEELDKVDRYFTQIKVDDFVWQKLREDKEYKPASKNEPYRILVDQFQLYRNNKEEKALKKKFQDGRGGLLMAEYHYLQCRLAAIEEAVQHFLGIKGLKEIEHLYEQEMTRRILEARDHA
jgi:hypothetical protein